MAPIPESKSSLFERLKQARIVQVLVVYLGATWVVLQLVDTLVGLLSLPEWVGPVAVMLLGVGFVVVLATAWVQSLPATTAAEEAGEIPTDWEVAPGRLVESLKAGRLPHLTWGRAILGGIVALCLLFGAAGVYVVVTGGQGLIGPAEVGAEASPTAVAVLPFQTRGADLEVYGEGMVDLLTANLEGLGGLRTINAGTVVARWRSELGETLTAELDQALRVAGGLNARYAVRGSVVDAGGRVRLSAEVFDLVDGSRVDGVQVEGTSDEMLDLVDALTVQLAAVFVDGAQATARRTRATSTQSLPALEAYLRGEALYRQQRFDEAIEAFRDATVADSLFALAWWRLSDAWGWIDPGEPEGNGAVLRAEQLSSRLPQRERMLLRAEAGIFEGSGASVADLRNHLSRHPDDADAWNTLAEFAGHAPWLSMSPPGEFYDAIASAVELLPSFGPYYIHLIGLAIAEGRREEFEDLLSRMTRANPDDDLLEAWPAAWDFNWGTADEMAEAEAFFRSASLTRRTVVSLSMLQTDVSVRAVVAVDLFTGDVVRAAFPFIVTAVEVAAGSGPDQWSDGMLDHRAPGYVLWALLVGEVDTGLTDLSAALSRGPLPSEAVSLAVVAALARDDALRDEALAALPDTAWTGPYGLYGGAADAAEARRTAEAVSFLRDGDPQAAVDLLAETLDEPKYDALAVYLMGDAYAALGQWPEAIRYWEVLLRSSFRPHVRLGLARAHEALGDTTAALEGYHGFLTMWDGADPTLPPMLEATDALARLRG